MRALRIGAALLLLGIGAGPAQAELPREFGCAAYCQFKAQECLDEGEESRSYCSGVFYGCYYSCMRYGS